MRREGEEVEASGHKGPEQGGRAKDGGYEGPVRSGLRATGKDIFQKEEMLLLSATLEAGSLEIQGV